MPTSHIRRRAAVPLLLATTLTITACGTGKNATAPPTTSPAAANPASPNPTSTTASKAPAPTKTTTRTTAGTKPAPARKPRGPLPDPAKVNRTDPDAVGRAALITIWTQDSKTDTGGQHDAMLRALPYLSPAYSRRVQAQRPTAGNGILTAHGSYTIAVVERLPDASAPADTPTKVYRVWSLDVTVIDNNGDTTEPTNQTVYTTLTRTGDGQPWTLDSMTLT